MMDACINFLARLGQSGLSFCARLGQSGIFMVNILWRWPRPWRSLPLLFD